MEKDKDSDRRPFETPPVEASRFRADVSYDSLSETSLNPGTWCHFASGQCLAAMHSIHILHGGWHPGNYFFNTADGTIAPIDFDGGSIADPDPRSRAVDFAVPFLTLDPEDFHALIAGYVEESWLTDPAWSDNVGPFLDGIGIKLERLVAPRTAFADLDELMTSAGLVVQAEGSQVALRAASPSHLSRYLERNPESFLIALSGMAFAGLDCSEIATGEAVSPETELGRHIATLFDQLCRRVPLEPRADYDSEYLTTATRYLSHLQRKLGYPRSFGGPARVEPARALQEVVSSAPASLRGPFLDCMVDVNDFLATRVLASEAESGSEQLVSPGFAQWSLLILLNMHSAGLVDDSRLLTMLRRHGTAEWKAGGRRTRGSQQNLTNLEPKPFLGQILYLQSKGSLLKQVFESSMQHSEGKNLRWSAAWRALQIYRDTSRALAERIIGRKADREFAGQLDNAAKMVLQSYAGALFVYVNALGTLVERARAGAATTLAANFRTKYGQVMTELEAAAKLIKYCNRRSVHRRKSRKLLQGLLDAAAQSTSGSS